MAWKGNGGSAVGWTDEGGPPRLPWWASFVGPPSKTRQSVIVPRATARRIAKSSKSSGEQLDGKVGIAVEPVGAGAGRLVEVE